MSKIDEIFKSNPSLLKEPEVKELINYVDNQFKRNVELTKHFRNIHDRVLEVVVHSEIMLVKGESCEDCVKAILSIYNEND